MRWERTVSHTSRWTSNSTFHFWFCIEAYAPIYNWVKMHIFDHVRYMHTSKCLNVHSFIANYLCSNYLCKFTCLSPVLFILHYMLSNIKLLSNKITMMIVLGLTELLTEKLVWNLRLGRMENWKMMQTYMRLLHYTSHK